MQTPAATQGVFRQFLLLAGALFVLMLVLYFGLAFGYKAYLSKSIADTKTKIDTFSAQIPKDDQARVANFYSQLQNLQQLLGSHTTVSPALALFERATVANVYLTKLSVNAAANEIDVNGAARNLSDIAEEAALIEAQTDVVDHVNFSNGGASQGIWQFTMNVFLKPGILHNGNPAAVSQSSFPPATLPSAPTSTGAAPTPTSSLPHP